MNQKRSKLQAVYFPTLVEQAEIIKEATEMEALSDAELLQRYNDAAKIGIFGARAQHKRLVSLGWALKKRFGDPLVHFKGGLLYLPCTVELLPDGSLRKTEFTDWD
jgi:hypothetical protein